MVYFCIFMVTLLVSACITIKMAFTSHPHYIKLCLIRQYIEANTQSPDFSHLFPDLVPLHSFTNSLLSHPSNFLLVLWDPFLCSGKRDRKSTRLNSSHQIISYAVFCLKKKIIL